MSYASFYVDDEQYRLSTTKCSAEALLLQVGIDPDQYLLVEMQENNSVRIYDSENIVRIKDGARFRTVPNDDYEEEEES